MQNKRTILITGASSGIGKELALQYSSHKDKLLLFGRNKKRLIDVQAECTNNGAEVEIFIADVRDQEDMNRLILDITKNNTIDIIIACAGVSSSTARSTNFTEKIHEILNTNINGVLNTILPYIPYMIKNSAGKIAIISSMAGLITFSNSPAYSASKAAIINFTKTMSQCLKRYNIKLSLILPGYINTPMTINKNKLICNMLSTKLAAKKIIKGIHQEKKIVIFPYSHYLLIKMLNCLPNNICYYLYNKLNKKNTIL
ncbi:SDR family NAD(P)-dependent oxidoreductase [Rickettsia endosymbiont of Cardiosporidium cionae]|uniref:SDR family NAD(P)-dependent oxidoreductase n=1 Tax=Rickettsia endosymbiont of Cardiosporidium cionae TaxID=2777155 RepID=UPI0018962536|nr:SDR family NAD(P)-dependent oxidoreductase [Rickettsia endosymbiont of Cardiosporidium cionae]KAF8818496.1 putative oxidoreductase [Rickettsia endosymbiont of Cardiosporidium cionae]